MSAEAGRAEAGILRHLSDRLAAPLPRKTSFLEEFSSDVRALTGLLVREGLPPEVARRRALETLVPNDETLRRLEALHQSWYRRATRSWHEDRLRRMERFVLAATFVAILTVQTAGILQAEFLRYVSPFLWPVLASGALVMLATLKKAFDLWVKEDHARPRSGLRFLVALSGAPVVIAVTGVWLDVHRLAGILQVAPELQPELALRTLIQDAALLSISILFALFGALGWLLFTQWLAIQEDAHRRALDSTTLTEV